MKKRVILLYDCPMKVCDKLWVAHGLTEHGYEVKTIGWPFRISHLDQRGKLGAFLACIVIMVQCMYAMCISKPDDVIFCWLQKAGIYCNWLSRGKRRILSYNWLTPRPKKSTREWYAAALENPMFHAIVNTPENKEKNLEAYRAKDLGNISYIPDVYEENIMFQKPAYQKKDMPEELTAFVASYNHRYCFMGGRANRDWKLFLQAAKECPEIAFVGIAASSDWDKDLEIPSNVMMKFDTPPDLYYALMSHAYLAVYPLAKERVSGLINILKGTMEGIPVLITELPVTSMYYPEECHNMLFKRGDCADMCRAIRMAYSWSEEEYTKMVDCMQKFVQEHFSPKMASGKIAQIMASMWKNDK